MKNKIMALLTMLTPCIAFAEDALSKTPSAESIMSYVVIGIGLIVLWFIAKLFAKIERFFLLRNGIKCKTCGYTSRGETICPNCGASLDDAWKLNTGCSTIVIFFAIIFFIIFCISGV